MSRPDGLRISHLVGALLGVLLAGLLVIGLVWPAPSTSEAPIFPNDLIISEVMPAWPSHPPNGLIITKIHHNNGDTTSWMELYNPHHDTYVLRSVFLGGPNSVHHPGLSASVGPGEYLYVCHWRDCGRPSREERRIQRLTNFTLRDRGGVSIFSEQLGDTTSGRSTQVGWGHDVEIFQDQPASNQGVALVRRQNEHGCPIDTRNNQTDFRTVDEQPSPGGYAHCEGTTPDNINAYVEIYNPTNQPIDPVGRGYSLINANHPDESAAEYELVGFPNYPYTNSTTLQPGQVGMVVAAGADTLTFDDLSLASLPDDWRDREWVKKTLFYRAQTGQIRLYTLRQRGTNEYNFFEDGLSANPLKSVTLLQPFEEPGPRIVSQALIHPDNPGVPERTGAERPTPTSSDTMVEWYVREYGTVGDYVRE